MATLSFKEIQTLAGRLVKSTLSGVGTERTLTIFTVPSNRIARIVRAHQSGLDLWYTITSADGAPAGSYTADAGVGRVGVGLDLSGTWMEAGDSIVVHDTYDQEGATGVPQHHPAGFLVSLEIFDVVP
tara:strand:+ start:132 stop:515 length:384 start_codon:yes stop_codon:yes gene_type:complete